MNFQVIRSLKLKIQKIDLDKASENALRSNQELISDLNRDQLRIGMKSDGSWLPPYSANSVTKFGKPPGKIKLFDTGDFYEGIKPEFAKTDFVLTGKDKKTEKLKADYGDNILGLSNYSISELADDSLGQIQYEIKKQIGIL